MIKNKKGISFGIDAFSRLIIMIVAFWFVFEFGGKVWAAAFGGSNIQEEFNKFVAQVNELNVRSRQAFVVLDKNTAIVGFSKNADSFKCLSCGSLRTEITSYFKKPDNKECKEQNENKACICLCKKSIIIDKSTQPYGMKCDEPLCKTLKKDLIDSVELKDYIEELEKNGQSYPFLKNSRWSGGFLYEKQSGIDFILNGLPKQQGNRFTVFIQQDVIDGKEYVAVCPHTKCIDSFKPSEQINIPPSICQVMYQCIDSLKIPRVPPDNMPDAYGNKNKYCVPIVESNRLATRYFTEEECRKSNECVNRVLNIVGECIFNEEDGVYVLSYK